MCASKTRTLNLIHVAENGAEFFVCLEVQLASTATFMYLLIHSSEQTGIISKDIW